MSEREARSPEKGISGRQAYNVVTDVVTGPNIRLKDNLYQALAILACVLVGTAIGFVAIHDDRRMGATLGAVGGLVVGFLGSGLFLMIYRAMRHAQGKHD